jgi:fucose 4-O-acetylase-like acetyltransferase
MLARIGVVIFFSVSGFFYYNNKSTFVEFWKKRIVSLILPWLIIATMTFILKTILGGIDNFIVDYLKWVFGVGSWYYYISVLLVFYLIFRFVKKNDFLLYLCLILNVISIALETYNINVLTKFIFQTPYLNLFNHIGYFAFGILCRKYRLDRQILENKWLFFTSLALTPISIYLFYTFKIETDFHLITFAYKIPLMLIFFYLSSFVSKTKINNAISEVGKNTYFIYLSHMQIVQFICNRVPIAIEILKPIIGLAIMLLIVFIIKVVFKKLLKWEYPLKLVGLK